MHQYIDRASGGVVTERLFGDRVVRFLYSSAREHAPTVFRWLTGRRTSALLAFLHFDARLSASLLGNRAFLRRCGMDLAECVEPPAHFTTPRRIFERRIRYWECRPLPEDPAWVVAPADARAAVGSLAPGAPLFLKGKFFELDELFGPPGGRWTDRFRAGDFAIFRLTPDRYHWNHVPVSGEVVDFYELGGALHACNPSAVIELATPYSKNRRAITVIDSDVAGGSQVGLLAMVEVAALMVGDVVQAYSAERYEAPRPVAPGLRVERGQPKSFYRPGSSTDLLLFEPGRVRFAPDLLAHASRSDVRSRFSAAFGRPLVEVDVRVRSPLAVRARGEDA